MVGQFPSCRHDGSPFGSLDSYRAKRKLQPLGLMVEYGPYLLALQLYEV